jgi:hypothetical protein
MSNLLHLAQLVTAASGGNIKPDRLAHRHRQAMICFFCTNWDLVYGVLMTERFDLQTPSVAPRVARPAVPDPLSIEALLNH